MYSDHCFLEIKQVEHDHLFWAVKIWHKKVR